MSSLNSDDEKILLTEEFYDLWDCTDPQIVKQATEIRDGSESLAKKRKKLRALVKDAFGALKDSLRSE